MTDVANGVSAHIAAVATGAEEMTAAIAEISRSTTQAAAVAAEAEKAAELADDLLRGVRTSTSATVDNQAGPVPSVLMDAVAVTKANIAGTVIKDGLVTPSSLCAGAYADACRAAGIGG